MSWVAVGTAVVGTAVTIYKENEAADAAAKGGKKAQQAYDSAQAAARAAAIREAQRVADQAAAQKLLTQASNKSKSAKTSRTVMVLAIVGGTILTAITVIGLTLKHKK